MPPRGVRVLKSEARKPKSEGNPKHRNTDTPPPARLAHFGFRASDFLRFSLAREVFLLLHWADFGFRLIPTAFRAPLLAPREPEQPRWACLEWPADIVIYRSRPNAKINRNFEVFENGAT